MIATASTHTDVAGINRPAGTLDAATALVPYHGPWNPRLAAHLLRRAGFGGSPDQIAAAANRPMHDAVEALIHFPAVPPASPDAYDPAPDVVAFYKSGGFRGADDMAKRDFRKGIRKKERSSILALQLWWLNRMLTTPAPLQEKMTLYFHGHFTTAAIQKGVSPAMVYNQNDLFRRNALGNLRDLTWAVSTDPAMLLYLDNAKNDATHPNENYARELMELFTLGVDHYSENDVRESARAWTGWKLKRFGSAARFVPGAHDSGIKRFLGHTGNFGGQDIVNVIFGQPQCATFFASSLLNFFVYNNPEPQLVDALASAITKHSYQLAPVLSMLLQSNVFYSNRAYRALIKSPVEYLVGTYNTLGLTQIEPVALGALAQMGQVLFYPPNVAGWPGGSNWMTSQTTIARENFVAGLVNSQGSSTASWMSNVPMQALPAAQTLVNTILHGDASPRGTAQIADYLNGIGTSALGTLSGENFSERVRGAAYLTMAMPAYQLN
ncbi:MAG: DUF1800 domain-containing protein [Candidatus Eremiobacteraeota bacterium]|nr:DUF1800 domain-containing protein [Candidatus Eremiobacteraeota bacterium]